jgi:hypothetical protein
VRGGLEDEAEENEEERVAFHAREPAARGSTLARRKGRGGK